MWQAAVRRSRRVTTGPLRNTAVATSANSLTSRFDRLLLERFAEAVRGRGPVCDLGCGPGQIAKFLHELRVDVLGVDFSPGMVDLARRLNPDISILRGDMYALDVPDGAWAGIAAFYSLIHIPRADVRRVLIELRRVLQPAGRLVASFHLGREDMHLDELWGETVSMDFTFFQLGEMEGCLTAAGFDILERHERPPYEDVEYQSQRGYVIAVRPSSGVTTDDVSGVEGRAGRGV